MANRHKITGLSIIIPVKNEQDAINDLCKELMEALRQIDFKHEVIFVDDGSTDSTLDFLKKDKNLPKKNVLSYFPSKGQSEAIHHGVIASRYKYIGVIDGDGQNDPKDLILMYEKIRSNTKIDMIQGNRYPKRNDKYIRKIVSRLANFLIRKIAGIELQDLGCGTKVFHVDVAKQLQFRGEIHRVYAAHAYLSGFRVIEMNVNHRLRKFGISKYGYNRTWKFILDLLFLKTQYHFNFRPIYTLGSVALGFFLISVTSGMTAIILRVTSIKNYLDGSLVSLSIIMFSLSIILFFQALIANEMMRKAN